MISNFLECDQSQNRKLDSDFKVIQTEKPVIDLVSSQCLIKSLNSQSLIGSCLPLAVCRSIWAFLLLHSDGYGWLIYIDL